MIGHPCHETSRGSVLVDPHDTPSSALGYARVLDAEFPVGPWHHVADRNEHKTQAGESNEAFEIVWQRASKRFKEIQIQKASRRFGIWLVPVRRRQMPKVRRQPHRIGLRTCSGKRLWSAMMFGLSMAQIPLGTQQLAFCLMFLQLILIYSNSIRGFRYGP